jgi:hypothetical protein
VPHNHDQAEHDCTARESKKANKSANISTTSFSLSNGLKVLLGHIVSQFFEDCDAAFPRSDVVFAYSLQLTLFFYDWMIGYVYEWDREWDILPGTNSTIHSSSLRVLTANAHSASIAASPAFKGMSARPKGPSGSMAKRVRKSLCAATAACRRLRLNVLERCGVDGERRSRMLAVVSRELALRNPGRENKPRKGSGRRVNTVKAIFSWCRCG